MVIKEFILEFHSLLIYAKKKTYRLYEITSQCSVMILHEPSLEKLYKTIYLL